MSSPVRHSRLFGLASVVLVAIASTVLGSEALKEDWLFQADNKPTANRVLQENGRPTPEKGYVTDRLGDAACRFIVEHREEAFFLFVSFTAPHGPLQAKPEHLKRLAEIPAGRRRRYAGLGVSLGENGG